MWTISWYWQTALAWKIKSGKPTAASWASALPPRWTARPAFTSWPLGADPNLAVTRVKIACDSIHDSGDRFMAYYTEALDRKVELKDYVSRHMDEAV